MFFCLICNKPKLDMDKHSNILCKDCYIKGVNAKLRDKSDKMLKNKREYAKSLNVLKVNRAKICKANRDKWLLESKS